MHSLSDTKARDDGRNPSDTTANASASATAAANMEQKQALHKFAAHMTGNADPVAARNAFVEVCSCEARCEQIAYQLAALGLKASSATAASTRHGGWSTRSVAFDHKSDKQRNLNPPTGRVGPVSAQMGVVLQQLGLLLNM